MTDRTTSTDALQNVDAGEFAALLQEHPKAELIDVRTSFEFTSGHLPDAHLYDMMDPEWADRIDALDRDGTYFLYCRSGSRSYQAGLYMQQLGFRHVYNLADGIISWDGDVTTE